MFATLKQRTCQKVLSIPVLQIIPNPNQPRKLFDQPSIEELARSIREYGVIQPLTVRESDRGTYELVAGERRLRAAMLAGLSTVPCIVSDVTERDSAVMALIENLQRQDLNFFEEALAIERLIDDYCLTQEEAARKLGKTQSTVANKLRLLRLPPELQERILLSGLTERHARALLKLPPDRQEEALEKIISRNLNVQGTEQLVEQLLMKKDKPIRKQVMRDVRIFVNTINKALDVMKSSGIQAQSEKSETDQYIQYKIIIPK